MLKTLRSQAQKARGQVQERLTRLERRTRVTLEQAIRRAEPTMRRAMAQAAAIAHLVRVGVKAGVSTYRSRGRKR